MPLYLPALRVCFFFISEHAWRKWPNGNYAIPMSVYGCPDQNLNNWKHNFINITYSTSHMLKEATLGKVYLKDDLYTLGPFGSHNFQYNFCIKSDSLTNGETNDVSDIIHETAEWPNGDYAILRMKGKCPDGE